MDLSAQILKQIEVSDHPLIVFPPGKNDDLTTAALALKKYLKIYKKNADIVSSNYHPKSHLSFVNEADSIQNELSHLHKFTLKIDVSKTKLDTLSYSVNNGWLSINLTPKHGQITKNNLRTLQITFKYDLIFILGSTDLESLGDIFFNNTDLFYQHTCINIDNQSNNEHFGNINMVDLSATSVSEMIYNTFTALKCITDKEIATTILTGIIASTGSFKTANVTPQTLNLAGQLMSLNADREIIIKNLFRTKTIATLKLWGKALSASQFDTQLGLIWTTITRDDFSRSGADEHKLPELVSDLIHNSPDSKVIVILFEDIKENNKIHCQISTEKKYNAQQLCSKFNPKGNSNSAQFYLIGRNLSEAEQLIIDEIKNNINLLMKN